MKVIEGNCWTGAGSTWCYVNVYRAIRSDNAFFSDET
jgi:hypothetical protein